MLVLSRRIGEQIIINDDIVVTVVSVKGNQVRLGFTAPQSVSICREELLASPPPARRQGAPSNNNQGETARV
jgi:carbon storage regulator CsrA